MGGNAVINLTALVALAANAIILFSALTGLAYWVKRWLVRTVSEPITQLHAKHDTLTDQVEATHKLAERAHERIDLVLVERSKPHG